MEKHLYIAQRLTAMVLAPLVLIHLVVILYAIEGGLSAAEILGRTQDHLGWAGFYSLFVVAVSIHAPIGLRHMINEWTGVPRYWSNALTVAFGLGLLALGLRAVSAVY
ncbi:MAG: succinate dehydrogenase [Arenicellales bacterium]